MICDFCSGETVKKKVTKLHWFCEKLYMIENVDADVCQKCGEKYYHVKTLKEVNHLISQDHDDRIKNRLEVEVITV